MGRTTLRKIKKSLQPPWRTFLFKWTRRIVLKYFSDGLTKIEGSGSAKGKAIAWTWTFSDENWEKEKNRKK